MTDATEHGTHAGYRRHVDAGEPACDACLEGNAAYVQKWRIEHPASRGARNRYQNARGRAMTRLAQAHPGEFDVYMAEELRVETSRG